MTGEGIFVGNLAKKKAVVVGQDFGEFLIGEPGGVFTEDVVILTLIGLRGSGVGIFEGLLMEVVGSMEEEIFKSINFVSIFASLGSILDLIELSDDSIVDNGGFVRGGTRGV